MDTDSGDWESVISVHFGRTPINTPFGSQESQDEMAIDLSYDNGTNEPDVNISERVRLYVQQCEQFDTDSDDQSVLEYGPDNQDLDLEKIRSLKLVGCQCSINCSSKFSEADIYKHLLNVQEMDKNEKDMYIMGVLGSCEQETKRGKKRVRSKRQFSFHGQQVCKKLFMLAYSVGEKALKNLFKHIDQNGAVARCHGNTGKRHPRALSFEDTMSVVNFVVNYADIHGLPQPAAPRGTDNTPPIYLHCQITKKVVHEEYARSLAETTRTVSYTPFVKIWNSCVSHIRIASQKDDVCATCEKLRKKVVDVRDEEEKLESSAQMRDHIIAAQNERELYNDCIARAMNGNTDGSHYDHFTVDYCQNVAISHHGRQMGPLYLTSPRKIQMFGVRIDCQPKQLNFLIDEDETAGANETQTHGPNAVISMLDWVLENYRTGPSCAFHADNCPGQNKNQYILGYFMWGVVTGRHESIELLMQVPGHARCRVDSGFGLLKQMCRRSDCDTIDQLEDVVNKSAVSNQAVRFPSWQWRDWKSFLGQVFHPIKGMRSFQYFKFSSTTPGMVTVRTERHGPETMLRMIRNIDYAFDAHQVPNTLIPGGLALERQKYLYSTVRPLVRDMYKDVTCSMPDN